MKSIVTAMLSFAFFPVFAQDGQLDDLFGTNGIVTTAIGSGNDVGRSVKIQPDGKIVLAGYSYNGANLDFALARYYSDGSLDPDFGTDGKVTTDFAEGGDYAYASQIQPDGKIVVVGESQNGSDWLFAVARYLPNGELDPDFGTDGNVTTLVGDGAEAVAWSVVLQSDGKILVAGRASNGTNTDFALVRYESDGSLDPGFGASGIVITPLGTGNDEGWPVAVQSDGKILVAGSTDNGSDYDFVVIRYDADGTLDTSFGTVGKVIFPIGTGWDICRGLTLQPDGKILLAGVSDVLTAYQFALVRLDSDGNFDTGFGTNGVSLLGVGTVYDNGYFVEVQNDGKIIVAGYGNNGADWDFVIARFTDLGEPDVDFDEDGKKMIPIGPADDLGFSFAIQDNGNIVLGGYANNGTDNDFALIRLLGSSGPLPVELSSFTLSTSGANVILNWQTQSEKNNAGWEIEMKSEVPEALEGTRLEWETIGFVAGKGTTTEVQSYSFTSLVPGSSSPAFFRLKQIDTDGKTSFSQILSFTPVPSAFTVFENYPNPFNPETKIQFSLPEISDVKVKIHNSLGQEIGTLFNGKMNPGLHTLPFKADNFASGVYFYSVSANKTTITKKMHLMK